MDKNTREQQEEDEQLQLELERLLETQELENRREKNEGVESQRQTKRQRSQEDTCTSSASTVTTKASLSSLSSEVVFRVAQFLSAQDLCSFAQVCKLFSEIGRDDLLWKRLYIYRFRDIFLDDQKSWHKKYFESASSQLKDNLYNIHESMSQHIVQMHASLWATPPLELPFFPEFSKKDVFNIKEEVEKLLHINSKHKFDVSAKKHKCSDSCSFTKFGKNIFRCDKSGSIHVCDWKCKEKFYDSRQGITLCYISGRVFDDALEVVEDFERVEEREQRAECMEDVGGSSQKHWLAKAYENGYSAANEEELFSLF